MMIRQEAWWWVLRIFYFFFFLFIINRIFFVSSGMVEQAMSCAAYPFLKMQSAVTQSLQAKSEHKKTIQELHTYVGSLEIEQITLKARIAQLEAQQIMLEHSKEVSEFAQRYDDQVSSLSKVLLCYECPQEDVMFIEGGRNKNYCKDDVVVYKNALIGRIIEVYPWYSKVAVVTDKRCRISATVGMEAQGISCGKNHGCLELHFVPHYKKIEVGDVVVSTGNGLVYPSGFMIGVIETVVTDLVSHAITLQPYYKISDIPYVYVFLKQLDESKSEQSGDEVAQEA